MTDADLPPELQGPAAWVGPAMAARDDWLEYFTDAEVAELETAATAWAQDSANASAAAPTDSPVPLPRLAPRLARVSHRAAATDAASCCCAACRCNAGRSA